MCHYARVILLRGEFYGKETFDVKWCYPGATYGCAHGDVEPYTEVPGKYPFHTCKSDECIITGFWIYLSEPVDWCSCLRTPSNPDWLQVPRHIAENLPIIASHPPMDNVVDLVEGALTQQRKLNILTKPGTALFRRFCKDIGFEWAGWYMSSLEYENLERKEEQR